MNVEQNGARCSDNRNETLSSEGQVIPRYTADFLTRHFRISRWFRFLHPQNHETWNTGQKYVRAAGRRVRRTRKPSLRDDCPRGPIHSARNLQADLYCRLLRHCPLSRSPMVQLLGPSVDDDEKESPNRNIKRSKSVVITTFLRFLGLTGNSGTYDCPMILLQGTFSFVWYVKCPKSFRQGFSVPVFYRTFRCVGNRSVHICDERVGSILIIN